MLLPPPAARQTVLVLLFVLGLPFTSGCSSDRPGFENKTVPPMTDTAAIYQVHGIRFAVPEGLVPVTDRYVFTDLEPGKDPLFDPYNEITLFVDEDRSPEEILADVMDGFDNLYDGPHLHNQRRTRVNGRMVTQASITYTPRSRRDPDEPEDTVRVDYALIPNQDGGETWGFRLVPPDTTLTPEVAQDWADMINSAEAAPGASPHFVGRRQSNRGEEFCSEHYCVSLPNHWTLVNDLIFHHNKTANGRLSIPNVEKVREARILIMGSSTPGDRKRRSAEDLREFLRRTGGRGSVEESLLDGRHVLLINTSPSSDARRIRTISRFAKITLRDTELVYQTVSLKMAVSVVTSDEDLDATQIDLTKETADMHKQMYESINIVNDKLSTN